MDDLLFYILCNSISVISGQWAGDNESLIAVEPGFGLKRSLTQMRLSPMIARSVGKCLTY